MLRFGLLALLAFVLGFGAHGYFKIREINCERAEELYNLAGDFRNDNDLDTRISQYSEGLRLCPMPFAYANRAFRYEDRARASGDFATNYELALDDLNEVIRRGQRSAYDYSSRCHALAILGRDLDHAREDCDRALALLPDQELSASDRPIQEAIIYDHRGLVGLKQQRFEEAWNDYNAALQRDASSRAFYLYGRGIALLRQGRLDAGNRDIAAARSERPNIDQFYAHYGIAP